MSGAAPSWDEIRTALHVARTGTVSGAASALGVHHATVIRHVDALEAALGTRLFQRHAKGYTLTEAGQELMDAAREAEGRFAQLAGRIRDRGEGVEGPLVVTSILMLSPRLTPLLASFQAAHPGIVVRYVTDARVYRLEYGEAHVAIRAGAQPTGPDEVVQRLGAVRFAVLGAEGSSEGAAAATTGPAPTDAEAPIPAGTPFIGIDSPEDRAPFNRWIAGLTPPVRVVWTVREESAALDAVRAGAGLAFLPERMAGEGTGLRVVVPHRPDWVVPLWLVTHVDLHRTAKVQAIVAHLKAARGLWD